jgi:hypothetical protein
MLNYEAKGQAVKNLLKKTEGGSKVLKRKKKERENYAVNSIIERLITMLCRETCDIIKDGDMSFDEAIKDLCSALNALDYKDIEKEAKAAEAKSKKKGEGDGMMMDEMY